MNYIEQVNGARGNVSADIVVPPAIFDYALSLKQPRALARRETPASLLDLPLVTREIFKARKVGNASVRLALASYLASMHDDSVEFLGDMPPAYQEEILEEATSLNRYGVMPKICMSDEEVRHRLTQSKRSLVSPARQWLSYANFLPGYASRFVYTPPLGNNDSTLTQAFGRNSLPDADLGRVSIARSVLGTDVDAFESYLGGMDFDAGDSNRALASVIRDQLLNPRSNIEQVVQWEVAFALWENDPDLFEHYEEAIHVLWPHRKFYPTYDVKADSLDIMRQNGLYNAFELAHPDMIVRAQGILGKLGVQADALIHDIPFDPQSVQFQTRGKWQWVTRELPARLHHVATGRIKF